MKKIFFVTAISFLSLSSCRKEATTSSQDKSVAQRQLKTNESSNGGGTTFNDNYRFSVAGEQFYNPCTNELVTSTTWNVHFGIHGVYNGTKSTITVHFNAQGFKATDESGREYTGAGSYNEQTSYFSDGVFTTKIIHHEQAVTAGGDNNFVTTDILYVKVDADGNITYIREPISEVRCQ